MGTDLNDAMHMVSDALCLWLYEMETAGEETPMSSEDNEVSHDPDAFVSLIACDTDFYHRYYSG